MENFLKNIDEATRKRLIAAIEFGEIGFWDFNLETKVLICSSKCKKTFGRDENESFSYEDLTASIHKDDYPRWQQTITQAIGYCNNFEIELRAVWRDNSVHWISFYGSCSSDQTGETSAVSGILFDITLRKQIEEDLRNSEKVLANAQRIAHLGSAVWIISENQITLSAEAGRILDLPETKLTVTMEEALEKIHPEDRKFVSAALQKAITRNEPYDIEYRIFRPGKTDTVVHALGEIILNEDGQLLGMSGTMQDITDFKTAEYEKNNLTAQIRNQQKSLNNIIANLPGVIWETHVDTDVETQQVDFVSHYIEKLTGYNTSEWLSKPNFWLELVHPDDRERVIAEALEFLRQGGKGVQQYRWIDKNGETLWVETHMVATFNEQNELRHIQGITMDISERRGAEEELRKREEELLQAQKLESIGRLAGGIAHDFNNMLTAINGYSDLILKNLNENDPIYKKITEIRKAGERSASLTQQLLAFSRQQIMQTKKVSLNQIIKDTFGMLGRLLGEDIKIVTDFNDEKSLIKVDPGQLVQVILNLAINSRDAMPYGGTLFIKTENIDLKTDLVNNFVSLQPGSYVKLTVSDTGSGMNETMLDHIFEPFYTTKEIGEGTGLGLATVYGIVKQSNGHIQVESQLNEGTTFSIYFPRLTDDAIHENPPPPSDKLPTGSETVLLVEDEEMVRELIRRILQNRGYKIIQAANGTEALEIAQKADTEIDLLITDVVMPEMSGHELAKKLSATDSKLKVIYISGYTSDVVTRHGITENGANFIQKPFSPDELLQKVHQLLNGFPANDSENYF